MIADSLALSTFDLASACFGALRRQAGGSQANDSGLPEAGNGRSLGLNRLPFGGCRLKSQTAPELVELQRRLAYEDSAEYKIIEAYKASGKVPPDDVLKKIANSR